MATLDTTGVIAVKFQAATVQTIGADTFAHATGDIIAIPDGTTSITVDVTTKVACMTKMSESWYNRDSDGHVPFFSMDEIRTPV